MKIAISIEHPAWAHQFKAIIQKNNENGKTLVLAVKKDGDTKLLDAFGIPYVLLAHSTGSNVLEKGVLFLKLCVSYTRQIHRFQPDILIGRASPMMAVAAFPNHVPHVIFEDTEVSHFSLLFCKMFSTRILTPENFLTDLGPKQIRLPVYKELFYLHKNVFTPNPDTLRKYGMDPSSRFAIVRFISWNASHDTGKSGISDKEKVNFIKSLSQEISVYISSESTVPKELTPYLLPVPFDKVHQALYYATLVISEGASMASEAAILGTHAFYLNEIASGTTEEQQNRYHLLHILHDPATRYSSALQQAKELLQNPNLWNSGKAKRETLLSEMPDPNELFWHNMQEVLHS